jgi:hypothetical protein
VNKNHDRVKNHLTLTKIIEPKNSDNMHNETKYRLFLYSLDSFWGVVLTSFLSYGQMGGQTDDGEVPIYVAAT